MGTREQYAYGQSQYLRAGDIAGKTIRVAISGVDDIEFEKGLKPVLSFAGKEKRLVVNATNFDVLADAFGDNTELWVDKAILLVGEKVTVRGQRVDSIRVRVPEQPADQQKPAPDPGINDDCPF